MSNKKFGKKLLAAAMATAMAATMLAGCGDSKPAANPESSAAPAATTESSAPAESTALTGDPVEITILRDCFNFTPVDQADKVADAVNEYIKDKINVKIKFMQVGNAEYGEKANLALGNGEVNLLWTASWSDVVKCDEVVKLNAAYDITDLIKDTPLYNSMPQWVWDASSYNNRNYFVYCYKEAAEAYDLMFRKDLVDKHGWDLSTVKTLADIEPMLADIKADGVKYPFLTQRTALFYRWYMDKYDCPCSDSLLAVDRATNTIIDPILTDDYKEFVTLMCNWGAKGYISEDDATKTTPETVTKTQDWGISFWTDLPNNASANGRYEQEVTMVPMTKKWAYSSTTLGSTYCVTSTSTPEQAKACIDFLGLLYTDKTLADLYTYGIEGTDYDKDENGKIVKKGGEFDHDAWSSCNQWCVSLAAAEPDNLVELYDKFNNEAEASCAAGFRFNKVPVEAELIACVNVYNQYGYMLENGAMDPTKIDSILAEYQAALDEAGYQKVLAEAQSQYEAWKSGN